MNTTAAMAPEILEGIRCIPKVEFHVHLEGSIPPGLSLQLAKKNRIDIGVGTIEELQTKYRYQDFHHFLQLYTELTFLLAEPEDFRAAVVSYGHELCHAGAVYAELTLTLGTHVHFKGLPPDEVVSAAWEGACVVEKETGVVLRFLLDHVRSAPIERCWETVEWCEKFRSQGVVGLGLAGPEEGWPASTYAPALEYANRIGVPFVPHAGEAVDAGGIWDALDFAPRRIGHGVSAIGDTALVQALRKADTLVEACVTSNIALGHVFDASSHPLRRLWEAGVPVSINSDDPPMFGTSLLNEHLLAHQVLGFSVEELADVNRRAFRYALAPPAVTTALASRFTSDPLDSHSSPRPQ